MDLTEARQNFPKFVLFPYRFRASIRPNDIILNHKEAINL